MQLKLNFMKRNSPDDVFSRYSLELQVCHLAAFATGYRYHEGHEGHEEHEEHEDGIRRSLQRTNRVIDYAVEVHQQLDPGLLDSAYERLKLAGAKTRLWHEEFPALIPSW